MGARPSAQEARPRTRPERDLRAERAVALARRGAVAAAAGLAIDQLVCACGSERYGLPLAAVAQVLPSRPCTPMPGAVPALDGLIALSGRIVGVLSLARALGRPDAASDAGSEGHLIVLRGPHPQPLASRWTACSASPGSPPPARPPSIPTAWATRPLRSMRRAPPPERSATAAPTSSSSTSPSPAPRPALKRAACPNRSPPRPCRSRSENASFSASSPSPPWWWRSGSTPLSRSERCATRPTRSSGGT
ncbi:chemotaxis protein CheW [Methylobacterium sp. 092160098-2]|uniref:chemotaxis protein CheW n=1 Tax=Methylobacterium sp. 092160098-2 TaxID=3025129 RepID=UPI0023819A02|nr:chemotaxis protein CheW [Methylobacterium sp. 092160098-2]MDE4913083.1 chemotaxis protein CheW [Methylobacterium sp. 092160098-2]